ncbi:putative nucleotidyltransferase [Aequitasia blattaphilus]|uniref:Nucleotidyltransferase domain-containing protein n=1 Tax=Aequitasia blattaphilus TaxID=2949332 RepID=A0ABT1EDM9_9FIRM|nr:nucleotidyltransferase domain-containing protein [Aequitasia blattaphilus]MCP1103052.1 nucleotidyltransferase domain-containing protein [Aequitasia blattaphilus]MCR8615692.1 nucleotidyltransferase domain-containing protein [Aequitasia blattaphilus]
MNREETDFEVSLEERLLKEIIDLAKQFALHKVILFGSRARGDCYPTSDIDLAVSGGNIVGFTLAVNEQTATLLEFDVVSLDGSIERELEKEIQREGKMIYEKI